MKLIPWFVALLLLLPAGESQAAKARWRPLHMERGCVPLTYLYESYPELQGVATPNEVVRVMKAKYEEVKLQPFLEYLAMAEDRNDEATQQAESSKNPIYKFATKSNAVFITWRRENVDDGVVMFTEELCRKIYGNELSK
jgi:hypothetical protein